jgi:hypothetical protein
MSPADNPFDGIINPYAATTWINGLHQFYICGWTNGDFHLMAGL